MNPKSTLRAIKLIHTVAWAFFGGCILAIPVYAWMDNAKIVGILCAVVFLEVLILVANSWKCSLTPIAGRYTEIRQDNFDIYLPVWVARYNKGIFGSLYVLGIMYTFVRWLG